MTDCVSTWIEPLRPALPDLTDEHLAQLQRLERDLGQALAQTAGDGAARPSARLRGIRHHLAEHGIVRNGDGTATTAVIEALAGMICGFYDLDLRDATGPGHGRMILRQGTELLRRRWATRLAAGDLVGIAATERHGGSRLREITTRASDRPGGWRLTGEKCWISRLKEADAFVVFFKDPTGQISAAVVDATAPGLRRRHLRPAGLGGWTWGVLSLSDVAVDEADLIGSIGGGLEVFRQHFASFRPLVAATALGTAASVHTQVTATLRARLATGILPAARDTALVTLARTHIELNSALLAVLTGARLAACGHPAADTWSRAVKASAVETAYRTATELPLLVGAAAFQADCSLAKAQRDLHGLLFADGIHDALLRSAGRQLLSSDPAQAVDRAQQETAPGATRAA